MTLPKTPLAALSSRILSHSPYHGLCLLHLFLATLVILGTYRPILQAAADLMAFGYYLRLARGHRAVDAAQPPKPE